MNCSLAPNVPPCHSQRGFSMIEVLITMLIISLAVLGVVGLQAHAMRLNQGGLFRAQAVFLAGDLAERMEANKVAAIAGSYEVATSNTPATSSNTCATTQCTGDELASNDLSQWQNAISQTLPQASWSVTLSTAGNPVTYTIVISWIDRRGDATYADEGTGETFSYTSTRTVLN
jgi:type IV pilus assembly protein PilV